jgi:hypothetical protein
MTSARRYQVGRDLRAVAVSDEEVCLEGRPRLRPGQVIVLAPVSASGGCEERQARVQSWFVARVGKDGALYRGVCRWIASTG